MSRGDHWHRPERIKRCIRCGEDKLLGEFYAYAYTTKQGKRSTRYYSRCKPCERANQQERFAANPRARLEYDRKWRAANPARFAGYRRKWKAANTDHCAEYERMYRQDPEVRRAKAQHACIRQARIRAGFHGKETRMAIRKIYAKAREMEKTTGIKYHVDHIIPLSKGGKHEADNLQILTAYQNLKKAASITCPK